MAQRWKAMILTQSNVLQNVEIETPGISRSDAIAQVKSTYGAKEVKFCNPVSSSSSSSGSSWSVGSSGGSDGSFVALLIVGGLILLYVFRYVILIALVVGTLYYLYKWLFK
jgi:hypothetical protein